MDSFIEEIRVIPSVKRYQFTIICLFIAASSLIAQVGNTGQAGGRNAPQTFVDTGPDTTIYNYYNRYTPDEIQIYNDTLLHRIDNYNPALKEWDEHLTLGNLGSSATPMRYEVQKGLGIRYGYDQFDLYNYTLDSIKIFKLNRPLNNLYFSPFLGQDNFLVKALFAREFSDGISLFLDYKRYNQVGTYNNQATQTTNLSSTILLEKEKLKGIYTLLVNTNNEENNGGITADSLFRFSNFRRRVNFPIVLNGADTRKESYTFAFLNRYILTDKDKLDTELMHELVWERGAYRSSDVNVATDTDSLFYTDFLVDGRGLRHAIDYGTLSNEFGVKLASTDILKIRLGLIHKYHTINFFQTDERFNELILKGALSTEYKGISLKGNGELGLLDLAGDFDVDGKMNFDNKNLKLSAGLRFYRYTPNLKADRTFINEVELWNNDFSKPLGTAISGRITVPKLRLKAEFKQIVENNTIYWDSLFIPRQLDEVLTVSQLNVKQSLKLGPWHLDHALLLQGISSDSISLPNFHLTQNTYLQFKLFDKKLEAQLGAEAIYFSDYNSKSYLPLTGTFGNTQNRIDNYPILNAYINFKIEQFNFFFRFENINSLWEIFPYYHLDRYPQYDNNFRIGVRWILTD